MDIDVSKMYIEQLEIEIMKLRRRLRKTCQILVEELGATGPVNAEEMAQRAVDLIKE